MYGLMYLVFRSISASLGTESRGSTRSSGFPPPLLFLLILLYSTLTSFAGRPASWSLPAASDNTFLLAFSYQEKVPQKKCLIPSEIRRPIRICLPCNTCSFTFDVTTKAWGGGFLIVQGWVTGLSLKLRDGNELILLN